MQLAVAARDATLILISYRHGLRAYERKVVLP
jgi:hypothetical protein